MRIGRILLAFPVVTCVLTAGAAAQARDSSAAPPASATFYPNLPARFWSHSHPGDGWQTGLTGYVVEGARECAVVGRLDDVLYMVGDLDSLQFGGNALPVPGNRALDSVLALPGHAWHRADLSAIKKGFKGC